MQPLNSTSVIEFYLEIGDNLILLNRLITDDTFNLNLPNMGHLVLLSRLDSYFLYEPLTYTKWLPQRKKRKEKKSKTRKENKYPSLDAK